MKRVSRQSDVDGFVRQVLILGASRSPFWGPTGPLSTSPKSSFRAGQLKKGAGEDSRPADVLLPHWIAGQDAALDVTVVNPCQTATVIGAATTARHALNHAYARKMRGTADACQQQGVTFLPIVVESFGGWHEAAVRILGP